ncbi:FAD-binding oxidoreductase [Frankia sp. CcI49]|uniref:FAD-binding oxidoreductase n=1 Tax=Frankia sp. CcI49 TaxID=1745382 RepID=UPI00097882A4|nr:FAD-linked oxidase C-terminal domain-containing protein [Frankia sp. CcI49]ONH54105.1 FAD-binding oxidoreductase [Frankia sp. CcI49]
MRAATSAGSVSQDPADLTAARADRSGWPSPAPPAVVVRAAGVDDVRAVLRLAHEYRVPVVPRGAGTGLAGGAVAGPGELVLSLERMNRIRELSPADMIAVVEPGVRAAELDQAAAAHGLRYAPDPASHDISTLGGNIATNAGGLRCAKYGVTREAVLGLDVVLPGGDLLRTGRRTVKGVTGYDLTALLVGSEGTLGVVVAAALRLQPIPPGQPATVAAYFRDAHAAAAAAGAVLAAGVTPALLELLDARFLAALDAWRGTDLRARGQALLLAQTDGSGAEADADRLAAAIREHATVVEISTDPASADELLAARRLALPAIERLGRPLIEDVAVPRSRLADMVEAIARIGERHDVVVATLAHAADGNLHPIFVVDPAEAVAGTGTGTGTGQGGAELGGTVLDPGAPQVPEAVWRAADEVFTTALEMGGTLTGEHGVGLLKRRWVAAELGDGSVDLQRRLRAVFDPRGILNRGKVLPDPVSTAAV